MIRFAHLLVSLSLGLLLAACSAGGGGMPIGLVAPVAGMPGGGPNAMDPNNWEIGPIIDGKNSSVGMPLHPAPHPAGWVIELPQPSGLAGHAHYITFRYGSLAGKSRITLHYRIEADPGVTIVPTKAPGAPAILALYFQRAGDDWSGTGKYETYRWWASSQSQVGLTPGDYEMSVALSDNWTAVMTSSAATHPGAFRDAVDNADRVGFTLGGGDGLGHGVYATGPARIIVTDFRVE